MDGGKGKPISFRIMTACLEEGTDRPLHLFHGNKELIRDSQDFANFFIIAVIFKKKKIWNEIRNSKISEKKI